MECKYSPDKHILMQGAKKDPRQPEHLKCWFNPIPGASHIIAFKHQASECRITWHNLLPLIYMFWDTSHLWCRKKEQQWLPKLQRLEHTDGNCALFANVLNNI